MVPGTGRLPREGRRREMAPSKREQSKLGVASHRGLRRAGEHHGTRLSRWPDRFRSDGFRSESTAMRVHSNGNTQRPSQTSFSGRPARAALGRAPTASRDQLPRQRVVCASGPKARLCVPELGSRVRDNPAPERHTSPQSAPRGLERHKGVYQMKSIKIMGLCLVAAFLMSAVAVATASATKPEFRFSGAAKGFSSKSGAGVLVQKASATSEENGSKVECTSDTDNGEIEGASGTDKVTNVLVLFSGCKATVLAKEYTCTTSGQLPGVIKTNQLEGQLGYINESKKEVGLVLKPKPPAELFAEFECTRNAEKLTIKVRGEIIGKITPVNKFNRTRWTFHPGLYG